MNTPGMAAVDTAEERRRRHREEARSLSDESFLAEVTRRRHAAEALVLARAEIDKARWLRGGALP